MNNISALLQEAKPLYLAQKKRRKQIKTFAAAAACACFLFIFSRPNDLNYNIEEELYLTETGGFVEDMGLPTDEFGLLKVV